MSKFYIIIAFTAVIVVCCPFVSQAQSSIFSGLSDYGSLENLSSSRAVAMGGAGIALHDSIGVNFLNPALMGNITKTRVSIGGYLANHSMRDTYGEDTEDWAQLEYFSIALCLRRGLSLGFFITPRSRSDFRYNWDVSLGGVTFNESRQGSGGLSRAALNLGWTITPWTKIGGGLSTTWGEVEESRISYTEASGFDQYIEFLTTKQWLSFGGSVGLIIQPFNTLSIGAIFEPEVPIQLDKTFSYTEDDSSVFTEAEYRLAARYGFGISFRFSPKLLAAGQLMYSPWGDLDELPPSLFGYQNSYETSVGAEWTPGSWDAEHFLSRMEYRFGFRLEDGYTLSEGGSSIRGYFASFGLGYPFHKGNDRVDLTVEYGLQGDLSRNGGQENILKIRMGLNLGETWFVRPKPSWED